MKNNELYDQWKRLTLNSNIESSEKMVAKPYQHLRSKEKVLP